MHRSAGASRLSGTCSNRMVPLKMRQTSRRSLRKQALLLGLGLAGTWLLATGLVEAGSQAVDVALIVDLVLALILGCYWSNSIRSSSGK